VVGSGTLLPVLPGKGVICPGCLRQPDAETVKIRPNTISLVKSVSFMFYLMWIGLSGPTGLRL
jgi:hypothetical protein